MNRYLLILTAISLYFAGIDKAFAQQQVENSGFEMWEEVGFGPDTLEPVNWSSLKTSDGGDFINGAIPLVWEQSSEAHSGDYSIKLINMPILTLVAPGTLTNGRVHAAVPPTDAYVYTIKEEPQWNTEFTDTPDSLVVWAKFSPVENDIAHAYAILHSDTAKAPDSTLFNYIAIASIDIEGSNEVWTRFSAPFNYLSGATPEYILFAIFAGDAQQALAGSVLYLDDVELIYNENNIRKARFENVALYFTNNKIVIESPDLLPPDVTFEIFDLNGKRVLHKDLIPASRNIVETDLNSGTYICHLKNREKEFIQKIVK
ncbi:MAG: T9SS type A sorting domain-containing protein [Bacteroidales bacterium]|nr:T9SS type A sorting domain-containing protein [Bacteroidales bacterium]